MELAQAIATTPEEKRSFRDKFIVQYIPYVKRIVNRMSVHLPSNAVEIDDLTNAGIIGLIQAVDKFDPTMGNKFLTYAVFRIKGAVLSELRSKDFLSRSNRKKIRELENTYMQLEQKLGREVDDSELAKAMGIALDELYDIKKISCISFLSFDEIGYRVKKDKTRLLESLTNRNNNDAFTMTRLKEIGAELSLAIEDLPEKQQYVLSLYYIDGLTMKELGKVLNLTESRVSQLHSNAISYLRQVLRKKRLLDD